MIKLEIVGESAKEIVDQMLGLVSAMNKGAVVSAPAKPGKAAPAAEPDEPEDDEADAAATAAAAKAAKAAVGKNAAVATGKGGKAKPKAEEPEEDDLNIGEDEPAEDEITRDMLKALLVDVKDNDNLGTDGLRKVLTFSKAKSFPTIPEKDIVKVYNFVKKLLAENE